MIGLFGLSSLVVGRYIGVVVRRLGERRMIAFGGAGSRRPLGSSSSSRPFRTS